MDPKIMLVVLGWGIVLMQYFSGTELCTFAAFLFSISVKLTTKCMLPQSKK